MPKGNRRKPWQDQVLTYAPPPVAPPPYEPKPFLNVEVLGSKNSTVAKVTLARHADWNAGSTVYRFEAADSSKREQGDVFDPVTGEMLALGRALQRISRELFSEANKRVKVSTEAQLKARQAAYDKARAAKKPVHRRTKEEWDEIQRQRAVDARNNQAVRYNPHDAEVMARFAAAEEADREIDATGYVRTQLQGLVELLTPSEE